MRRAVEILLKFTRATGHPHPNLRTAIQNYRSFIFNDTFEVSALLVMLLFFMWGYASKLVDPKRLLVFMMAIPLGFAISVTIRKSSRKKIWGVPAEFLVGSILIILGCEVVPLISEFPDTVKWIAFWVALGCTWGLAVSLGWRVRIRQFLQAPLWVFLPSKIYTYPHVLKRLR